MWALFYLTGWAVTAVLVCRSVWLGLDSEDRDEGPGIARALSLAAGIGAGLVWPAWWLGVALRPVLWPEPDPDLDAAFAEFQQITGSVEDEEQRDSEPGGDRENP